MIGDQDLKAVVKVMVTSPTMSRWVSKDLDRKQIFDVPEDIEYTNQGFNSRAFGRVAKSRIKELETTVQGEPQWPTDSDTDDL